MADRRTHNELSGSADVAAQVRTVKGGITVNGPSLTGVALVFAILGLVLVATVRRPDTAPVGATAGTSPAAVTTGVGRVVEPIWELAVVPKGSGPLVVARDEAENLVRRTWPAGAHLRNPRAFLTPGEVRLRADVVLSGASYGVVESVVIDLGDVYSVLVITAQR